ncbi:MAG: hypothetical protein ABEJ58_05950 [Halodesulfurarchaeum sp.]
MTESPEDTVVGHLEMALEEAENESARYHIRQALQYLAGEK